MKNNEGTAPQGAKRKTGLIITAVIIAICIIAAAGAIIWSEMFRVSSIVELDVNPSIEIEVSKNEKVRDVDALNDDAEIIIGDMDFDGVDIDVVINALIGSMVRHGYIDEINNSVLVSVSGTNSSRNLALQTKLEREIGGILRDFNVEGAVIGQTVTADAALKTQADIYDISLGKTSLIQKIVDKDVNKDFGTLANASISELVLLAEETAGSAGVQESGNLEKSQQNLAGYDGLSETGKANRSSYIGETRAQEIAFADAGIAETDAKYMRTNMDYEHRTLVYEVEFVCQDTEYEYEIRATDGFIMKKEADTDADIPLGVSDSQYIGEERAKEIALENAGLSESQVTFKKVKLDYDDGIYEYEIEFISGGMEYEYTIDAVSGRITDHERDFDD